jgi:hypothetical protein
VEAVETVDHFVTVETADRYARWKRKKEERGPVFKTGLSYSESDYPAT